MQGTVDARLMLQNARDENMTTVWTIRFLGYVCCIVVISLFGLATHMAVVAYFLPVVVGTQYHSSCLIPAVDIVVGKSLTLFVIVLGWLWYQPHIAWPLVAVEFVLTAGLLWWGRNKIWGRNLTNGNNANSGAIVKPGAGVDDEIGIEKPEAAVAIVQEQQQPQKEEEETMPVVVVPEAAT
jgi:hypothetical protein